MLRDKEFIVLDEATASLDATTAKEIEALIFEKAHTLVMITHRLSEENYTELDQIIELG